MKILLIDPPFGPQEIGGAKKGFKGVLNIIPSLGLAYLGAVAEQHGHMVRIIDGALGLSYQEIVQEAQRFGPHIVGLTATTPTFLNAVRVASLLREERPQSVFIAGGAHPTAAPSDALKAGVFDFLVLGEGEETFLELVQHIEGKGPTSPDDIRGIAFRRQDETVITIPRPRIKDLDSLPFPARYLLPPLSAYHPTPASYRRLPLGVVMASRGCPMHCTFCDRAVFGNIYRLRSPQNVMDEVEELIKRYGAREIRFFDDTFTLKKDFVFGLCDEIEKRRLKFPWTCLTTVLTVTRDMLKRMREVGCWQVLFGLESGDDGMLRLLKKGNTVEANRRALRWAQEAGLEVRADFIIGTPGETMKSLNNTLNFALKMNLDYAHFNKFIPFPGTEIYRQLLKKGYKFDFSDRCSVLDHSALLYVPEGISKEKYRRFLDGAFKKFYLRPTYIIKRLLSIRSFAQLKGQVKGSFAILNL